MFSAVTKIDKTKIIIIGVILILSVFIGLIIRISFKESRLTSEQKLKPASLSTGRELEELNIPILPIPKPDLKNVYKGEFAPNTTIQFFENINKAAKTVEKSLMPDNALTQKTSITTSAGIILTLTKDQFHFLYPDNFIIGLIKAQTVFIKEFDPAYEPLAKIETDAQVRFVEEKIIATLLSINMITKERAEQFITTIRFTLPELQLIDLQKYYSYGLYQSSPFSKFLNTALGKTESPRKAPRGLFLPGLAETLENALTHKALAVCGSCQSRPECFQEGASIPNKAGSELFFPACYCTGCLTSLGCLSANSGRAAIFDQTTGICGVGL